MVISKAIVTKPSRLRAAGLGKLYSDVALRFPFDELRVTSQGNPITLAMDLVTLRLSKSDEVTSSRPCRRHRALVVFYPQEYLSPSTQ